MSKARRTQLWFSQAGVQGILGETEEGGERDGEGEDVERTVKAFKEKGGQLWEREGGKKTETEMKSEEYCTQEYYCMIVI